MTIADRYVRATSSSHLALKESIGDVDVLIAAGWVEGDSVATALYRMRHTGRAQGLHAASAKVTAWVNGRVKARVLKPAGAKTKSVVERTLFWWLNHACEHCGGRGHPNFPGTPVMKDDENCEACAGTGITPLASVVPKAHLDMAELVINEIERESHGVFGRMAVALKG